MRPIAEEKIDLAYEITNHFPHVHGCPIFHGNPEKIGIDLKKADWGEPARIEPGEVPVFWACGVTPQAAIQASKPDIVITHKPGHMFITDILDVEVEKKLFSGK